MPLLIITADDYGYTHAYDEGIVAAARAGALDSVSAMVTRDEPNPVPLHESGVEVGLHLELEVVPLEDQLAEFERWFGRPPAYLDGHHHCHARGPEAVEVANLARERDLPVRSVDARHRRLLRCKGVATPDRLVGRVTEDEPVMPLEVEAATRGEGKWGGRARSLEVIEWMTHPGHADPSAGSAYDAGREEDLRLLLDLTGQPALREMRTSHASLT